MASALTIENYVSCANLGMRFDLSKVVVESKSKVEYVPKKNCVILKIRGSTALLFASGKLVTSGKKDENSAKIAARQFVSIVQKLGYANVSLIDFKITSIVAYCKLPQKIALELFALAYPTTCTYEPEVYPALIYHHNTSDANSSTSLKMKILLFPSGKNVFTGCTHVDQVHEAHATILPLLAPFPDHKTQLQ